MPQKGDVEVRDGGVVVFTVRVWYFTHPNGKTEIKLEPLDGTQEKGDEPEASGGVDQSKFTLYDTADSLQGARKKVQQWLQHEHGVSTPIPELLMREFCTPLGPERLKGHPMSPTRRRGRQLFECVRP